MRSELITFLESLLSRWRGGEVWPLNTISVKAINQTRLEAKLHALVQIQSTAGYGCYHTEASTLLTNPCALERGVA